MNTKILKNDRDEINYGSLVEAISQAHEQTQRQAAIADLEAELKMKRDVRDDKYVALNDKRSKVGMGVTGDPAYGNDSLHNARNGLRPQIREEVWPNAKEKADGIGVATIDRFVNSNHGREPGKLPAWLSPSHVEKTPKKKETPTPSRKVRSGNGKE